jgi:phytoene dehydrogenase-like protein
MSAKNYHLMLLFRPILELCFPSSLDPTLAPPGSHVMSVFSQFTPYDLSGDGWTDQKREEYADVGQ